MKQLITKDSYKDGFFDGSFDKTHIRDLKENHYYILTNDITYRKAQRFCKYYSTKLDANFQLFIGDNSDTLIVGRIIDHDKLNTKNATLEQLSKIARYPDRDLPSLFVWPEITKL
jgi:hypothetical protein